ncbi:glycine cleavage system protein R [Geopsychrobacter electrodiphilus]|uniref:glycine cleavage system protein R n=1 Tax=Geopsychrobacter electrodiphilus TaxID=225196 RepID=UPI00035F29EE|nr:ACT domain-containing protein [Geopsychrobacter electrodiphilus]
MSCRFILTAFGKDRPGIVADVTRVLYENDCNLEENSMTLLADEFTLILLFSATDQRIEERLLSECRRLEKDRGISAFIRVLGERRVTPGAGAQDYIVEVEGLDQSGIVFRVSQHLADLGLNILDLKSQVKSSPESGTALYQMQVHIQAPPGMTAEQIETSLAPVADELHVDISVTG